MRFSLSILILVLFFSCEREQSLTAQHIVDKTIEVSGKNDHQNLTVEFDFRNRHYTSVLQNGNFDYSRVTKDTAYTTIDTYGNTKVFSRSKNDIAEQVADSMIPRIKNSINSVNYFVLLPYGLNDAAVNKTLLQDVEIKGVQYFKIKVTFNQDGGGEDFEDVYIYWIHQETFKIDYLAYSFEVNGGGMRFREAYNERYIQGIRFVDYNNYKPIAKEVSVENLEALFEQNKLKLLSKIETENIVVSLNSEQD